MVLIALRSTLTPVSARVPRRPIAVVLVAGEEAWDEAGDEWFQRGDAAGYYGEVGFDRGDGVADTVGLVVVIGGEAPVIDDDAGDGDGSYTT